MPTPDAAGSGRQTPSVEYILIGMKKSVDRPATPAPTAAAGRAAARAARRDIAYRATPNADAPEDIRDAVWRLKRERIVATAVELFYNQGLTNTTLEQVAQALNVTKPFIYSHFKSKSDLLAEICSRGIRASLDALNRAVVLAGTPTEKLKTLARDFMLAVLRNQAHIAIYNREEKQLSAQDRESINNLRREFDHKFSALLEEGVAAGEFVVEDVQLTSLAIGGIVSWSYVWYRPGGRLSPTETADRVAGLVLAIVQAKSVAKSETPSATPSAAPSAAKGRAVAAS